MKLLITIMSILSITGLLSTLICGLWIKQQAAVEASSISFHMTIGVISVVLTLITMVLLMIKR